MSYFVKAQIICKTNCVVKCSCALLKRHIQCASSGKVLFSNVKGILHKNDTKTIEEKLVYNSKIKHNIAPLDKNVESSIFMEEIYSRYKTERPPILALKYLMNDTDEMLVNSSTDSPINNLKNESGTINLPYERYHPVILDSSSKASTSGLDGNFEEDNLHTDSEHIDLSFRYLRDKSCEMPHKKWMRDYNKYTEVSVDNKEEQDEEEEEVSWDKNYGSPDPNVRPSTVPCGGCGAFLHCQDSAIPGYLPKEIFVGMSDEQLQALVCQRCHFLREYNTALSINVDPEIYPKMLSQIKNQKALVILVVDMTDFPCSIWPGILDIIGPKRPLVVVGNKIDLLQDWSKTWLEAAKRALVKQLPPKANLLHTTLVSAKTGYGIEELITSLYNLWEYRGDVYLVGCTNVGKSTLFNALLQSDYCKTKAVDLLQRATTAPWPGTTLNLLKFPIMRPEGWKLAMRSGRLRQQKSTDLELINKGKIAATPQMISCINRTFTQGNTDKVMDDYWEDPFAMPKMSTLRKIRMAGSGLDPSDPTFALSKWLYDTPGVVTQDQIINLLTTEELMLTLPREAFVPRSFSLWAGQSILIGGLACVDYIDGPENIKMTVLAAKTLPVTICFTEDTQEVYHHYLGSEVLAVPCGGEERLQRWPGLQASPVFVLKGDGWKESCADVVLSSAGWIAVTAQKDSLCRLQAWTPGSRGIYVRVPPVLPRAIAVKGKRMYKSPAHALFNEYIKKKM